MMVCVRTCTQFAGARVQETLQVGERGEVGGWGAEQRRTGLV